MYLVLFAADPNTIENVSLPPPPLVTNTFSSGLIFFKRGIFSKYFGPSEG